MSFKNQHFFISLFLFAIFLAFQNCSGISGDVRFSFGGSKKYSLQPGNGEPYDGKLKNGDYLRVIPGHRCDKIGQAFGSINVNDDKIVSLISKGSLCNKKTKELRMSELKVSAYNLSYVSYREGVYIEKHLAPKVNRRNQDFVELLCRWRKTSSEGIDIIMKHNPVSKKTTAEIIIGSKNKSGQLVRYEIQPFKVNRGFQRKSVEYKSPAFHLSANLSGYIPGNFGSFTGQVSTKVDNLEVKESMECQTAGGIDGQAFPLDFIGKSSPSSAVNDRLFDEISVPAWILEGLCDPKDGNISVYGPGLDGAATTNCNIDGSFQLGINYDVTPPFFSQEKFGAISLWISQFPATPKETTLFRTSSSMGTTIVTTGAMLQSMSLNLQHLYILANDIDLATEVGSVNNWNPIGRYSTPADVFSGTLDGNGHTIYNLHIDIAGDNVGLLGYSTGKVHNLKLVNSFVRSTARNSGALIGFQRMGEVTNCSTEQGAVYGIGAVGGLIGYNWNGIIRKTWSTGTVYGQGHVGGLIGRVWSGPLDNSFSRVQVIATNESVGGLIGYLIIGSIGSMEFSNVYATGDVQGQNNVGGLIGYADEGYVLTNSYAKNAVSGTGPNIGPLIGYENESGKFGSPLKVINSYWDAGSVCTNCSNMTGQSLVGDQWLQKDFFKNWSFNGVWIINEGFSYPEL